MKETQGLWTPCLQFGQVNNRTSSLYHCFCVWLSSQTSQLLLSYCSGEQGKIPITLKIRILFFLIGMTDAPKEVKSRGGRDLIISYKKLKKSKYKSIKV